MRLLNGRILINIHASKENYVFLILILLMCSGLVVVWVTSVQRVDRIRNKIVHFRQKSCNGVLDE